MADTGCMVTWHKYFIEMADFVAAKSKDKSTKCGAVIVGPDNEVRSMGYNGFPRGVNDDIGERHNRPEKYLFTAHAEQNAIHNAARVGIPLKGCTIYLQFGSPCSDCVRAIIQAGIIRIITRDRPFPGKGDWEANIAVGNVMLVEAGIEVVLYEN